MTQGQIAVLTVGECQSPIAHINQSKKATHILLTSQLPHKILLSANKIMDSENILKRLSILCVEDKEPVRSTFYRFMKRRFGNVYMACDGKEGLEMYLQYKPDIVITDNEMPIMDGITMANMILEINNKQPIIITKSFDYDEDTRPGLYTIVKKPVDIMKLKEAIYSCLGLDSALGKNHEQR